VRLILEHSLSPRLAAALAALEGETGHDVVHLRRWFPDASTDDPTWLMGLRDRGEQEAAVLTADPNIYRNQALRTAWLASGLTVFFLKSFADLPHWEQAARLVKWWPEITRAANRARRGSGFTVRINGKIELLGSRQRGAP